MSIVTVNVNLDVDVILDQIGEDIVKSWLRDRGVSCLTSEEADCYVNLDNSIGTMPFYKVLTDAIDSGKMSLEMLVGHVAMCSVMKSVQLK